MSSTSGVTTARAATSDPGDGNRQGRQWRSRIRMMSECGFSRSRRPFAQSRHEALTQRCVLRLGRSVRRRHRRCDWRSPTRNRRCGRRPATRTWRGRGRCGRWLRHLCTRSRRRLCWIVIVVIVVATGNQHEPAEDQRRHQGSSANVRTMNPTKDRHGTRPSHSNAPGKHHRGAPSHRSQ